MIRLSLFFPRNSQNFPVEGRILFFSIMSLRIDSKLSFDDVSEFKSLFLENAKNAFWHRHISLVKKKFVNSTEIVAKNIDILCVAETELDETVRSNQFLITCYKKHYDLDTAARNGGILVYTTNLTYLFYNLPGLKYQIVLKSYHSSWIWEKFWASQLLADNFNYRPRVINPIQPVLSFITGFITVGWHL